MEEGLWHLFYFSGRPADPETILVRERRQERQWNSLKVKVSGVEVVTKGIDTRGCGDSGCMFTAGGITDLEGVEGRSSNDAAFVG